MGGTSIFRLFGEIGINGVQDAERDLDRVSDSADNTGSRMSKTFSEIGTKAGDLGKKMGIGLLGIGTALVAGAGATREFRQDFGKLQTTFQTTGSSAETATSVFKDFYGLLGEDDTSIEASNHLAMMTNDQKSLSEWTNICTGIYAKFGDSLPLEGLTEAANETMRVGQVTGPLADALNWASMSTEQWNKTLGEGTAAQKAFSDAKAQGLSNEDAFNAALLTTNSEAEREAMIRKSLNGIYSESASTFKKMNGDIIDSNKAQADLSLQLNETMNKLEPLITKGKLFLAEVLQKLEPYITWIIDNIKILAPILLGFIGALFALNIASKIMALIPVITALNTVVMTNPIVLIIMAIIAAIVLIIVYWDELKAVTIKVWNAIKDAIGKVIEGIKKVIKAVFDAIKLYFTTVFNIYKTIFTTVWNAIKTAVTTVIEGIKKAITFIFDGIKQYFTTIFNVYKTIITTIWDAIKTAITTVINGIKTVVTNVFNGIKNTISSVFNGIKTVTTNTWNGIKTAITTPIEKAKSIIGGIIDKIKGLFNFKIKFPKIPMPHFGLSPSGWKIGDLLKGSIPKLKIDWYAEGGIFSKPTLFDTQYGFKGVGEAGAEAIAPIDKLMGYTRQAVSESNGNLEGKLDVLINLLNSYLPDINKKQVVLSTGEMVGALVDPMDRALGDLADKKRRGR